jgi:uncharacterized membrane protein
MPLITNDAVVFGILIAILAGIFITAKSDHPFWKKFYTYVPALLLCYFVPSVFNSLGIISAEESNLYYVASRYLLPASLVLLTLSIDIKAILNLGPKAVVMFLTATVGIVIGGPIAILLVGAISPEIIAGEGANEVWRGLSTVAGSWIGGGANQTAMFEVFQPSSSLFSAMVTVDIIVANIWMAFLLYGAGMSERVDEWFKADSSAINELKNKVEAYRANLARIPTFNDIVTFLAVAFGVTAVGHLLADIIAPTIGNHFPALAKFSLDSSFFWLIVIATSLGFAASFTNLRKLEGAGASKFGSLFIYVLVTTIGMQMDVLAIFKEPGFFLIGIIWILIHVGILLTVGKLIKAPFFFVAVGSQANIGGAASAPVVASAFHPALAPVGVLLAVFGYALGTYGAYLCALLMKFVS